MSWETMSPQRRRDLVDIGLLLMIGPLVGIYRGLYGITHSEFIQMLMYSSNRELPLAFTAANTALWHAGSAYAAAFVTMVRSIPLKSVYLPRFKAIYLAWGAGAYVLIEFIVYLWRCVERMASQDMPFLQSELWRSPFARHALPGDMVELIIMILAACVVGFAEEFFYRGVLFARLQSLLGRAWVAALISTVIFAIGHLYQGIGGGCDTLIFGIIFAGLAYKTGAVWPGVIAHSIVDINATTHLWPPFLGLGRLFG